MAEAEWRRDGGEMAERSKHDGGGEGEPAYSRTSVRTESIVLHRHVSLESHTLPQTTRDTQQTATKPTQPKTSHDMPRPTICRCRSTASLLLAPRISQQIPALSPSFLGIAKRRAELR